VDRSVFQRKICIANYMIQNWLLDNTLRRVDVAAETERLKDSKSDKAMRL
jgi:hypothetical protein